MQPNSPSRRTLLVTLAASLFPWLFPSKAEAKPPQSLPAPEQQAQRTSIPSCRYDGNGRLTSVSAMYYTYDGQNRLKRTRKL